MRNVLRPCLLAVLTVVFMTVMVIGPWMFAGLVYGGNAEEVPSSLDNLPAYTWSLGLGGPLIVAVGLSIRRSTRRDGVGTLIGWGIGLAMFFGFGLWLGSVLE